MALARGVSADAKRLPHMSVVHGGEPVEASAFGQIVLDLSTGINPHAFPVELTAASANALPTRAETRRLEAAARTAYRVPDGTEVLAAPGTQALLQWLPHVLPARRVVVVGPTYQEHEARWQRQADVVVRDRFDGADADLCVVVNPNNPDGTRYAVAALEEMARALLAGRGQSLAEAGHPVLIVDEAFMDLSPADTAAGMAHTLVLRSFGKFYGLAGMRLGFAIGAPPIVDALRDALGPWAVSGPAIQAGLAAFADPHWGDDMRAQLAEEREAMDGVLRAAGLTVLGGTDLYRLVSTPEAARLQAALAREGVWTRIFPYARDWIRFGLPGRAMPLFQSALTRAVRQTAS